MKWLIGTLSAWALFWGAGWAMKGGDVESPALSTALEREWSSTAWYETPKYQELAFEARVVGITDGDTVTVLTESKESIKVRLEGIDTPEKKQPFGTRAKVELSKLIAGEVVTVVPKEKDRYGRTIGRLFVVAADGSLLDVNLTMVQLGMAWHFTRYSDELALMKAEQLARQGRIGIWSIDTPPPVAPWEWRKKR